MVLGIGCYYLWRRGARDGMRERLNSIAAFVTAFVTRFRAQLATELLYLAFSPVSWMAVPFVPLGRKLKALTGTAAS